MAQEAEVSPTNSLAGTTGQAGIGGCAVRLTTELRGVVSLHFDEVCTDEHDAY